MTTKKKLYISASAILLLIVIGTALGIATNEGAFTTVTCGRFELMPSPDYLMTPDGSIFDTGASGSVILDDSLTSNPFVGIGFTADYSHQYRLTTFSFLNNLSLSDTVTITNILTVNQKDNEFFRRKGVKIILGMNVIYRANWLFSFQENRAEALPISQMPPIPSYAISIPFSDNRTPITRLKIRQTTLDFLIDTGYDGELSIQDSTALKEISNGLKFSTDTVSFNVLFGEYIASKYTFDSLTIEGNTYKNIVIRDGKLNLLGLNFLRRYDTMFWDSANKRMYLWNESSPLNEVSEN